PPPRIPKPPAIVHVLEVHEVVFVESADRANRFTPQQPGAARCPIHPGGRTGKLRAASLAPGPAIHPHRVRPFSRERREEPDASFPSTAGPTHMRSDKTGGGQR